MLLVDKLSNECQEHNKNEYDFSYYMLLLYKLKTNMAVAQIADDGAKAVADALKEILSFNPFP